ncbi:PHP domain-containing protein [Ignavibacterium sp.]|uniref:PHP domain-containing protein n=1 Tax=Ignavibacterium sp. TaxID=2651167 RepID=UPI00307FA21E
MIPLHIHSNFSLLTGTFRIDELIKKAKEFNIHALSLTDTNGMYGIINFYKQCVESGIKPILGCYINDSSDELKYTIFLAKNQHGFSDICRIITSRKLDENFDLKTILKEYHPNLIIITPVIEYLKIINPQNQFYAELIRTKKQKNYTTELYSLAKEKKIKVVATNPVYFLNQEDFIIHKLLRAIDENTTIANLKSEIVVDPEFYFRPFKELEKLFRDIPDALVESEEIAEQCNVNLNIGDYKFPHYPNAKPDSFTFFYKIVYDGFNRKYPKATFSEKERLEKEIEVITSLNFIDYFLIVWDIVQEAKRRGILYIGRGSAANSMVAYCLDLTQIEPIRNNLFFERFLNKARSSPPDVDLDFSWKERDEMIKYVFEKYGYENVAMISTHVTFRARSAFREVAKAFGISDAEISNYSKKIPWTSAKNLPNIAEIFPESKSLDFSKEPWKTIVYLASRIANFPRHLSIHPGGIVITPTKVTDYCALEYAKNKGLGLIITQSDMYSIEDLGLIKIDLLSQRSLGVLRDTMKMIKKKS